MSATPPNEGAPQPGSNERTRKVNPKRTAWRSSPLPPAHRNAPPGTSDAAARWVAPFTGTMRERVYAYIAACGSNGATDDEGETALGIRPQSYTPRRGELVNAGRVVDSGRRRPTASGSPAAVWIAVEHDQSPATAEGGAES